MQKKGDIETNYEIRSFDAAISLEEYQRKPKHPLYFVLHNLRSAFNVGSIFRTCDILRVAGLYLCGYTAYPPHVKLEKTSLRTIDFVPWKHYDSTIAAVRDLKKRGVTIWAAETTSISKAYDKITCPQKLAIILGNEALGVSQEILDACDDIVEIPTFGLKNSLNVAAACAVLGYKALESMRARSPAGQIR
ncbi:MAG: TrmH family RNA methyltransferase [Chitinivibrionales bacterium]|nr:TrmH family RNA methyltransferase [Chitinivibrionales bacterium]